MLNTVDFSPRRIWLGLTVPGKKMFRIDTGRVASIGSERANMLIGCYKGAPSEALSYAAICLHLLPAYGAMFGPAARDLKKPLRLGRLYGAILTDIRDFLKFRYRAVGLPDTSPSATIRQLSSPAS